MKIVLIDPLSGQSHGLKSISSYLKSQGHQIKLLFLKSNIVELINKSNFIYRYSPEVIKEILNQCADADLVGITVMTNAFDMAGHLSTEIKNRLKVPIIWGGIHPTIRPEECLQYADMVCIGEGENSMSDLTRSMELGHDTANARGIWFRKNGQIIKNQIHDPIEDLDSLPIEDFRPEDHLVLVNGKLVCLDHHLYYENNQYSVLTSRGCFFNCSYCAHNYLRKLYGRKSYLRKRSVQHFFRELKEVTSGYSNIKRICFDDDSFLIRPIEDIKLFTELYKREINLPFFCLAIPKNIQKDKMQLLFSAGMDTIQFGIQSTAPRILDLYNRPCYKEDVFEASRIAREVSSNKIIIHYDIILDNPYEKEEELIDCLKFLITLPPPFIINYFKLVFYPGIELTERAKRDGFLKDEMKHVYRRSYNVPKASYINLLFYLIKYYGAGKMPRLVLVILLNKNVFRVLNNRLIAMVFEKISKIRTQIKYG